MDQSYLIYLKINLPLWLLLLNYDTVDEKTSMHHDKVLGLEYYLFYKCLKYCLFD